jgi:DNA polymerase V
VAAGFPSPAQDYGGTKLDLNEHLIKDPTSTFLLRVQGTSMIKAGIFDGDEVIVDRSLEPKNNDVIVAILDGEFTIKRLIIDNNSTIHLHAENPNFPDIQIPELSELRCWGVVTRCLHKLR